MPGGNAITALTLTGAGIARALARLAAPAVDVALRERAEVIARDADARVLRRAEGSYVVTTSAVPAKAGTQ